MRHFSQFIGVIALPILLCACSSQAWYEGFKVRAENDCNAQPPGAREDCLVRLNRQPHDRYEQERVKQP